MTLRAIVVEDEEISRETLINYIHKYCEGVEVVAQGADMKQGVEAIKNNDPDLVFLDVEMPYGNAFDLLEQIENPKFETIFVTAYSHYAIKALNYSASYYLLKPVDIDELVAAVEKVKESKAGDDFAVHTRVLIDNIKTVSDQHKKVVLPVMDGFEVVQVKDIIRCQGNDNFTDFYLSDGSKKMICRTLKFYEDILSEFGFMRVHRSHLVNLEYVSAYKKGKGGTLTMSDGSSVDVSPSKKQDLIARF